MKVDDLSQLYYLDREIKRYDQRIDELRAQRTAISAPPFDREPSGKNDSPGRESKIERLTAEIIDLEELLRLNREKRVVEKQRLERFISGVDDSLTRQVMELRFSELLPWNAVAARMGGGSSVDALKKMVYRYLERHDDGAGETAGGSSGSTTTPTEC